METLVANNNTNHHHNNNNNSDYTYATLCPPPLSIHKKPRRATFRRRILRRSVPSQSSDEYVLGPLDDIIDVIKSNIWELPSNYSFAPSVGDWEELLKAPSLWARTPLPLSRIPSEQPLTIRKNRNSRSSATDSSMSEPITWWRNSSHDEAMDGGPVGPLPWPSVDTTMSYESTSAPRPSDSTGGSEHPTAHQALQDVVQNAGNRPDATRRRPSRLRLLTNGLPRLLRRGTGDTLVALSSSPDDTLSPHTRVVEGPEDKEPSDEAIEAYIRNNAREYVQSILLAFILDDDCVDFSLRMLLDSDNRSGGKLGAFLGRLVQKFPHLPELEYEHESPDAQAAHDPCELPTTMHAAVRVFTDKKVLTEEIEEIDIAIDIEGVLHNRRSRQDTTVDVIFVVDNGYYVTRSCLEKALDAATGALYHLSRGDRLALYTTHCTHNEVSGNRPEVHYPLRPLSTDIEPIFRDVIASIAQHGTQRWTPPRPNPSMTDVILGIVRSLEGQDLKKKRTHIMLLSPAAYVLHDVSTYFPDISIHRINPAILPYRREPEPQDTVCHKACCKNVFSSNWSAQDSVSNRIKRILKNARCEMAAGELTDLSVEIRAKDGCEIVQCEGSEDVAQLRLGQLHTFFTRIRVIKKDTRAVDLNSKNPMFNSSLDRKDTRQDLRNIMARGATKVHVLDVQILYRNSVNAADCWSYTETPLLLFRGLGSLYALQDTSIEVHKRRWFHLLNQGTPQAAKAVALGLRAGLAQQDEVAKTLIDRMTKEIGCHEAIETYEENYRQRLPLCPGPVDIESSAHEWLVDLWDKNKSKRKGVAVDQDDVAGLINGMNGLERLD
ncbi:hypothetical protein J1614_010363 [Plenodomus biglobosus]|nr:hypothetical protein J1614_010363 [Plenodomus biglobosus]